MAWPSSHDMSVLSYCDAPCETRGKLCSLALHLQDCAVHSTLDSIKTQTILGLSFIFTTFTYSSALFVFSSIIIACITPSLIHLSRISTSRQPSPTTPSFPVSTNTSSRNADQIPSIFRSIKNRSISHKQLIYLIIPKHPICSRLILNLAAETIFPRLVSLEHNA
ncbi:3-hydroxybenzoate 6-hydroxylase [Fusarium oxysporum f. sp. albedinis]|nr:3-hydroxybenzoate 6-hydroxylase [Fusarium oxysporum f. sp. albedinis]